MRLRSISRAHGLEKHTRTCAPPGRERTVKAILWVLGGLGTLAAVTGVGLTIAKTLHWI